MPAPQNNITMVSSGRTSKDTCSLLRPLCVINAGISVDQPNVFGAAVVLANEARPRDRVLRFDGRDVI
jgi:hypothetical protein